MIRMPDSLETELGAVFEAARSAQPLQFIFALVRVEGITSTRDPIGILRDSANQAAPLDQPTYCALLKPAESLLALIEKGATRPYFLLWIANADLLVKAP